ncbi:MAG TPA: NADH-quinone oxidoreductase subunit NuoH [Verrucomicrobiota bacterium]|nr:NADH-quinone oxidoreductase subunit NuoH [Verrucomicrobiota bacterium]
MSESIDQIFVTLKHWLVALFPPAVQPLVSIVLIVAAILGVFATLFAITTVFERKGLARIQNRYGPNRVGIPFTDISLFGFGQPIADGIKALIKEDFVPRAADKIVHFLAPLAMLVPISLTFAVLPIGRNMTATDMDAGLLFFFAVGAGTELAVFMAGWSSRNKYSLFGAMRAIAQMISYELPLILSTVTVVMIVGSLSPLKIVEAQAGYGGWLPDWFVFTPWGFAAFLLFIIAATAESNRSPFDLPEGESEIIAGYFLEYSGFKFAIFFMAEYFGMFAAGGMAATLFLGGYAAPAEWLTWIPSWAWFIAKTMGFIFFLIWIRGTVPRLRQDQLMNFAWKFMLPMALINIVAAACWHFIGHGFTRWFVCGSIVVVSYLLLGRGLMSGQQITKRTYRYAD